MTWQVLVLTWLLRLELCIVDVLWSWMSFLLQRIVWCDIVYCFVELRLSCGRENSRLCEWLVTCCSHASFACHGHEASDLSFSMKWIGSRILVSHGVVIWVLSCWLSVWFFGGSLEDWLVTCVQRRSSSVVFVLVGWLRSGVVVWVGLGQMLEC